MKYFYSSFSDSFYTVIFVAGRKGLRQIHLYHNKEAVNKFFMPKSVRDDYGMIDIRK